MFKRVSLLTIIVFMMLLSCKCVFANVHAGEGVRLYNVTTVTERDIFDDAGGMIEYKKFTETDSFGEGDVVAGAYVYNDSLTNGDCVEMNIIIVEYSDKGDNKIPLAIHLKKIHACPGDNGKFVYTEPITIDSSVTVKAMIWGDETIIPYGKSSGYTN